MIEDPWICDIGPEEGFAEGHAINIDPEVSDFYLDTDGSLAVSNRQEEEVEIPLIDEGKFHLPPTTYVPGHLACPIIRDEAAMIAKMDSSNFSCPRHKKIKKLLSTYKEVKMLDETTPDCYAYIEDWVNSTFTVVPDPLSFILRVMKNWCVQHLHSMIPAIKGGVIQEHKVLQYSLKIMRRVNRYAHLLEQDYLMMKRVELIKDKFICFTSIPRGTFKKAANLRTERDLSYFIDGDTALMLPTSLLLGALDKCQSMFGLKLYWLLVDCFKQYLGKSIFKEGCKLIDHFKFLRLHTGQDFFAIAQLFDSLVTGWTIRLDGDANFDLLYNSTLEDIQEILNRHNVEFDIGLLLPKQTDDITVTMWLELIGIQKVFGYPTLLGHRTLDQERANCMHDRNQVDLKVINNLEGLVKRDLSKNYFAKHGRYPNISECPEQLDSYFKKNLEIPHSLNKQYHLWRQIRFAKTLNYDFTPDQTELLKDSATCSNLSSWPANYDRCAFKILYNKDPPNYPPPTSESRTIGAFLNATPDEVRKLINQRENGVFDEENKICMQCMKELELKINGGREFTKQTAEQRLVQTSLEYNIANSIFPYVPEQSMTDGEILAMRRSLDQVNRLTKNSEFIALDISKWCFSFRHSTTRWLGKIYDDLFGLNKVYENSHLFFINCNIFSSYRMNPPDFDSTGAPLEGDYFLKKARGGKEGLMQKKWTHETAAAFKLAIEMSAVEHANMIVQGDNQAATLDYPKGTEEEISAYRESLLNNLHYVFNGINLELKKNETWYSKHLHEYGRVRVYKGNYVKQGTKKSTRLIPDINDGLFSITSSISALNTMTEGIAKGDRTPHIAFIINQILVSNFILRKGLVTPSAKNNPKLKLRQLLILLNTPADFGGLPLTSLMSHSVRGHDDKVILWISIAKSIRTYFPLLFADLMNFWITSPMKTASSAQERRRWYEDIYCLNINPLPTADNIIKKWSLSYLKSPNVTNPVIKQLYQGEHILNDTELFESIDTMEPMFLPLAHNLVQYSNYGLLLRMQHRLTSTKTLERVTQYAKQISLLDLIVQKNNELRLVLHSRLSRPRQTNDSQLIVNEDCPSVIARQLRIKSWGKDYLDTTSMYHHQVIIKRTDDATEDELRRSIMIDVSSDMTRSVYNCHSRLGPFKPYIGSETVVKITRSTLDVSEKTSFTKAILHLLKDRSWAHHTQSKNIIKLIDLLIQEKTSVVQVPGKIEDIISLGAKVIGGNPLHRYECESSSMAALINFLPTITTHFNQSSNNISQKYAAGDDISLFYQLTFLMNMVSLTNIGLICNKLDSQYVAVLSCEDCCRRIDNVKLDIQSPSYSSGELNLGTPISEVKISETESHIPWIESFHISRLLALNIDKNYAKFHNNSHTVEKLENLIKTKVSLNDLRKMNLQFLLTVMIVYSSHCRSIISSQDNLSLCASNDRSFGHLAELILNSGRLGECIKLLQNPLVEHTMCTSASKLSHHLARSIKPFFFSLFRPEVAATRYIFVSDLNDNRLLSICMFLNKIRYINKSITYKRYLDNVSVLTTTKSLKTMFSAVDVDKPYVIRTPPEQIQTLWRSSDQIDIRDPSPMYNTHSTIHSNLQFPIDPIFNYLNFKSNDYEEYIRIDEISHLSRVIGNISSAATKYIEIMYSLGFLPDNNSINEKRNILCLAEGSGSVITTLGAFYPNTTLSYNTWRSSEIDIREDSTNCLPPALVNANIDPNRFVNQYKMCSGETDILSDRFRMKLTHHLTDYPPFLITMDAESTHYSTNIQFVEKLIPSLLRSHPSLVIFKMFAIDDFRPTLARVISSDYRWVLWKPLSSNQHGYEIFLVILDILRIVNNPALGLIYDRMKAVENDLMSSYQRKNWMGQFTFKQYLYASKLLHEFWEQTIDSSLKLKSKYSSAIELNKSCSLLCLRNLSLMYEQLDKIHSNTNDPEIFTLIRKHGTNKTIQLKICDILFLSIYFLITHKSHSLKSMIHVFRTLCHLSVTDNIPKYRAGLYDKKEHMARDTHRLLDPDLSYCVTFSQEQGNFFDLWYDKKWFFKSMFDKPCRHKFSERGWTKSIRDKSLSHFVSNDIEMIMSTVPQFLRFYNTRFIIKDTDWISISEYAKKTFYSIPEKYYYKLKKNQKRQQKSSNTTDSKRTGKNQGSRTTGYTQGSKKKGPTGIYQGEDPRYESKLPPEDYQYEDYDEEWFEDDYTEDYHY